jgi:hypothetical protein
MPRPRSAGKTRLPVGLYERNGYFSWLDKSTGKEWGLGRIPRHEAIQQVLEVQADPTRAAQRFRTNEAVAPLAALTHDEIVRQATSIAHQCGIYFLVQSGRVMYVGQSIHVARRIAEHASDTSHPFEAFHFVPVARELLDDTEGAYIAALQPPWNLYRRRFVEAGRRGFGGPLLSP